MLFGLFEKRYNSLENPSVPLSSVRAWDELAGGGSSRTISDIAVTEAAVLGIPSVWAAVNTIAGTIAHLPFHLFRSTGDDAVRAVNDPLYRVIHDQANAVHTSYAWRKWAVSRLILTGRAVSVILRNMAGKVVGIVPVEWSRVTVEQSIEAGNLVRRYVIDGKRYEAWEVLDFVLMPRECCIDHYSPLAVHREAFALMLAAERQAATVFANGGVPALKLTMPPNASPGASARAAEDFQTALSSTRSRNRSVVPLPAGFGLDGIGLDPQQQQLLEVRQFSIGEVSRIFGIAPAMLHDLSTGTYSNVEQQNLNYAQHTITPLAELVEQEMNSKLFGDRNRSNYVEFNLDGLQRGDFLSRMNGLARAVNSALLTPNEARSIDNRPALDGGDQLLIQGATVPLSMAGTVAAPKPDTTINTNTDTAEATDE